MNALQVLASTASMHWVSTVVAIAKARNAPRPHMRRWRHRPIGLCLSWNPAGPDLTL